MINYIVGVSIIAAFIGYDVYLALDSVPGNTWSEIIGIASKQLGHPIPTWAPLIPGFVAGWLLWPSGG